MFIPNTVTINTMMKLYLKVNEPHNAILIHGLFKKYNIPQNEYSFNTYLITLNMVSMIKLHFKYLISLRIIFLMQLH